jgi:DNA-binding Lrp family transcriptional regulator
MQAMRAFILIQTTVGDAPAVAKATRRIDGVLASEHVTGPYDVVVEAEGQSLEDLATRVLRRLQELENVTRTITCPIIAT